MLDDELSLDRDTMYTLLSSRRRRNVLHALMAGDGETTVATLARQLAAWEFDKTPEAVSSKERKRTYTALRQTHLPKLAEHGIVEYDANRGTIELTPVGEALRPYLWPRKGLAGGHFRFLGGAVGLAVLLLLLGSLGVPPVSMLGGYGVAALVTLTFTAVGVSSYLRSRPAVLDALAHRDDTEYVQAESEVSSGESHVADGGEDE